MSRTKQTSRRGASHARDKKNKGRPFPTRGAMLTALIAACGMLVAGVVCWGPSVESNLSDVAIDAHFEQTEEGQSSSEEQTEPSPASERVAAQPGAALRLNDIPFDGAQAYEYLKQICAIGPRISGTEGMRRQQLFLQEFFQKQGGIVEYQQFKTRHPLTKKPVNMANMIIRWRPELKRRILLCAHYDTRPLPDQDPNPRRRKHGTFIGANDGASGVAVLMEMARWMPQMTGPVGVDFLLVDGEELVYGSGFSKRGTYFLGSRWFARDYVKNPPDYKYEAAVLLDMVADSDLQIHPERNNARWRDSKPLIHDIWATAHRLGVQEFHPKPKHEVKDDHIMLRNVGKIPSVDIIDFDYGRNNRYWHTEADLPNKCSALSLAKVGWVVLEWLNSVQ